MKNDEILQGRKIADKAELVWGWGTPSGQRRADRRGKYFIAMGRIGPGQKVLEIGCGTGVFTEKVAATGAEITALDISPELLDKARARINSDRVHFCLGNAEQMDFGAETFDVVIGSSVLHHLRLPLILPELMRVLKKGGRLVFAEPNMLNPQIFLERKIKFIGRLLANTPEESAFVRWSLLRDLRQQGFRNISVKPYDFLHPWTPAAAIEVVLKLGSILENIPGIREIAGSLIIYAEK
jgi:ubiquinone/menaquinone biosynthesis C-methylase UbiE